MSTEFGRIVALVIGFAVVQLVLLFATFRARTYNVNTLIAFVVTFTGAAGLLAVAVGPLMPELVKVPAFCALIIGSLVAMVVVGALFYAGVIRIPIGAVALFSALPDEELEEPLQHLRSIATVHRLPSTTLADVERLWNDEGIRIFIGFETSEVLQQCMPFIVTHPDGVFFSVGSTAPNVAASAPNLFRMLPSDALTTRALASLLPAGTPVVVVTGAEAASAYSEAVVAELRAALSGGAGVEVQTTLPSLAAPLTKPVIVTSPSVWAAAEAAAVVPQEQLWAMDGALDGVVSPLLSRAGVKTLVTQPRALAPFASVAQLGTLDAVAIAYEVMLRRKEQLSSMGEVIEFINANTRSFPVFKGGDRVSEVFLVVRAVGRAAGPAQWVATGDVVRLQQ